MQKRKPKKITRSVFKRIVELRHKYELKILVARCNHAKAFV